MTQDMTQDMTKEQNSITSIHFIGIGGVGMSGIAKVAHDQGIKVSGSDLRQSRYTDQLVEEGITVFIGHDAANVEHKPDVVVVSTAILENNVELRRAKELGIEIWHRAKMLSFLGRNLKTLAVAGTHGKTTTSSMLASTLDALGESPTFLIGGIVRAYGTNAHSGCGEYYTVEADESDKSFTYLNPYAVLVTNVEADHLDHYKNLQEIEDKFTEFMASTSEQGFLVVCGEDPHLRTLAKNSGHSFITYGFGKDNDVQILDWKPCGVGSSYTLRLPDGTNVTGEIKQNPGKHNVLNAAGVMALMWLLGYDPQRAIECLSEFRGVRRRFDLVGKAAGVTVVDDYAHHPTEIAATIGAAHELDFKRVVVLFQPHRYSRVGLFTEVLKDSFCCAFDKADKLFFMDVYPAGETPVPGVNGQTFLNTVLEHEGHPDAAYIARRIKVVPTLLEELQDGDLLITMGAGDVTAIGPQVIAELNARCAQ